MHETERARGRRNVDLFYFAVGNACDLHQVPDRSFDIAHSNSVIEHVITWDNMKNFARETRRVAAWHYVQTPYRSEEHTSELQSLMRISYAVFCLKKKNNYK